MLKNGILFCTNLWYNLVNKVGVIKMNVKGKYSALDIATWFIYKTNAEIKENQANGDIHEVYEGLTHLKLQKLLYYAQGVCLSVLNTPLFYDEIQAWEHGPVIKSVFDKFCNKGRSEIKLKDAPSGVEAIRRLESDTKIRDVLNMTYDNFAIYTAWQLRNMTHRVGSPWYQCHYPNKNKKIPNDIIKKYFDMEIMEN